MPSLAQSTMIIVVTTALSMAWQSLLHWSAPSVAGKSTMRPYLSVTSAPHENVGCLQDLLRGEFLLLWAGAVPFLWSQVAGPWVAMPCPGQMASPGSFISGPSHSRTSLLPTLIARNHPRNLTIRFCKQLARFMASATSTNQPTRT